MQVGMSINTLWNGVCAAAVAVLRGRGPSHMQGEKGVVDSNLVSWVSPARSRREDEQARRSVEAMARVDPASDSTTSRHTLTP